MQNEALQVISQCYDCFVVGMSVAFPLGDRTFPRYFVASPTTHLLLWANGYSVPLSAAAPTCTVRRRKSRTVFSEEQLLLLEESFQRNHYLSTSERQSIAQKLCLSEQQVKTWFQNRRTKLRRSDPSALLDSRCVDSWKRPVYITHILNNTLIIIIKIVLLIITILWLVI